MSESTASWALREIRRGFVGTMEGRGTARIDLDMVRDSLGSHARERVTAALDKAIAEAEEEEKSHD